MSQKPKLRLKADKDAEENAKLEVHFFCMLVIPMQQDQECSRAAD